jgi:Amt family ammonium transporter
VIGLLLLWFGWIFFNAASGLDIVEYSYDKIPQTIILNTLTASSSAGLTYFVFEVWSNIDNLNIMVVTDPVGLINSIMAGLVSITASSNLSSLGAGVIGAFGALIFMACQKLYQRYKVDDPL